MTDLTDPNDLDSNDLEWLRHRVAATTTERHFLLPSEWAEQNRYLPRGKGNPSGPFRIKHTPYLKEILDCLAEQSPVREIALMKGAQIGGTVTVLENAIGYFIGHVKSAPIMMLTATDDMAAARTELSLVPMFHESGLEPLIKSSDEGNKRKQGRTAKRTEWIGGGFMIACGAQTPTHMRSFSVQVLLRDEIDEWPLDIGHQGDPIVLSGRRTAAYERVRKVLDLSTPKLEGSSKIAERYRRGDQRRYHFRCLNPECRHEQEMRWNRDRETVTPDGEVLDRTGIVWDAPDGVLDEASVRYRCEACGYEHREHDKRRMFAFDNARWIPTATPVANTVRSYHLSALYGQESWAACVRLWLEAWDEEHQVCRDQAKLQAFYNTVLGSTFKPLGERIKFSIVSGHRRGYLFGGIPNRWAAEFCGSPVLLLTAAVDVHGNNLAVAVFGWCRDRRVILVDYWRFPVQDPKNLSDPAWDEVRKLVNTKRYVGDDKKTYGIAVMLIDSGYEPDAVYRFCAEFPHRHVYPIKGRPIPSGSATVKQFVRFSPRPNTEGWLITVDLYKDRWSSALKQQWSGLSAQPIPFFNAPKDCTDKQLKELTVETRNERVDSSGNGLGVFEWHRPGNARNELWDLLVYSDAALDITVHLLSVQEGMSQQIDWQDFYAAAANGLFFEAA